MEESCGDVMDMEFLSFVCDKLIAGFVGAALSSQKAQPRPVYYVRIYDQGCGDGGKSIVIF